MKGTKMSRVSKHANSLRERQPPRPTLFPYTTLFRSVESRHGEGSAFSFEIEVAQVQAASADRPPRSEEHTSELQSQSNLVCRLLLEKKNPVALENFFATCSQVAGLAFDFGRSMRIWV